ncbi:DUF423 domain-containing protein [Hyphomicrobium sp. NDB2Meth4]|uniref:DUF423 domain-containing protein n=1 Tax=Hyphomicrobium sp. NDB2Meth4 TaxID=1892846 RepID=UPI000AC10C7F|nr:DUF423 domain-containing protein [Hyphomicrobium sp. NDB2Meth4]
MEASSLSTMGAALIVYAGLAGAAGVALAAAGAHGSDLSALTPPAYFLIMHATASAAIIAVAARASHPGIFLFAAFLLLAGATLFSGDIALRTFTGDRLFPMAAPTGGTTMIVGWLIVALGGAWELFSGRG